MLARHAVPLLPAAHVCLFSATPPESTLAEVFILNSLNPFRMNACHGRPPLAQFWCNVSPFRINTCKSASKQTTLSMFRINTYEKTGGWGTFLGSERSNLQPFNVPTCFRRPSSSCISIRSGIHVSQLNPTWNSGMEIQMTRRNQILLGVAILGLGAALSSREAAPA